MKTAIPSVQMDDAWWIQWSNCDRFASKAKIEGNTSNEKSAGGVYAFYYLCQRQAKFWVALTEVVTPRKYNRVVTNDLVVPQTVPRWLQCGRTAVICVSHFCLMSRLYVWNNVSKETMNCNRPKSTSPLMWTAQCWSCEFLAYIASEVKFPSLICFSTCLHHCQTLCCRWSQTPAGCHVVIFRHGLGLRQNVDGVRREYTMSSDADVNPGLFYMFHFYMLLQFVIISRVGSMLCKERFQ